MPDDELEELRRLASLAGFVPYATSHTPWPSARNRAVESLNRWLRTVAERVREAGAVADPAGFLTGSKEPIVELIVAVSEWTGAWEQLADVLADSDDVASGGLPRDAAEEALRRLDRTSGDVRSCGKVYLAGASQFSGDPFTYAVAPLTNVALYSHRWCRDVVRRRAAEESMNLTVSSASRMHWGVHNLAGTYEDTTHGGVVAWCRELVAFVDAVLSVIVEVTVAAETVVRYHE